MIGYKGFDENLQCCGFQYEIGGEYQHDGKVVICEQGFHFCENPLDVFTYYRPGESRYAVVEGGGHTECQPNGDSKVVCSHLKVVAELTLRDLIQAGAEFVLEKAKGAAATTDWGVHAATTGSGAHAATTGSGAHAATTGPYAHAVTAGVEAYAVTAGVEAHAATTGPYAHAVTTGPGTHAVAAGYRAHALTAGDSAHAVTAGDSAHAATTGYRAHAVTAGNRAHAVTADDFAHTAAMGKESIAAGLGVASRAKGALGCWLVLAEYKCTEDDECQLLAVKAARVDGESIKPDTWYELKDGKFVETT